MTRPSDNPTVAQPIGRRAFLRRAAGMGVTCLAAPALVGCEILAARSDDRYTVEINRNSRFEPASLTVPVGATVVWKNMSQRQHAVTTDPAGLDNGDELAVPDDVSPWRSRDLFAGDTWRRTFTEPGTYVYACPYHAGDGMIGVLTVEAG